MAEEIFPGAKETPEIRERENYSFVVEWFLNCKSRWYIY
jgi:hypothetical protein